MSTYTSITLTPEEHAVLQQRLAPRLLAAKHEPQSGGRCEACNKVLEESEQHIRGYASGYELGLCRRCAHEVNTKEDIDKVVGRDQEEWT